MEGAYYRREIYISKLAGLIIGGKFVSTFLNVQLQLVGPMLKDGTIDSITAKITGEKLGATEGVWVQGGRIELPCKYFVYGPKEFKARVKSELCKRQ